MKLKQLVNNNIIRFPPNQKFIYESLIYETIMGSFAYGVSNDISDCDIYGVTIPRKEIVFSHINGYIIGFGQQPEKFESWQQHHIKCNDTEYDFTIFSIVKYFQLCMDNNPNVIDSLFTPIKCVTHIEKVGQHLRDNRKLFLSKKSYHTCRGYAFQQLHKLKTKYKEELKELLELEDELSIPHTTSFGSLCNEMDSRETFNIVCILPHLTINDLKKYYRCYDDTIKGGKRRETTKILGMDPKFAYHIVRLLDESEQILTTGDLILDNNTKILKSVRNGEWSIERIEHWFQNKQIQLEQLYIDSTTVPYKANESSIKKLLLECLEEYYGSLDNLITMPDMNKNLINDLEQLIFKYKQ